MFLIVYEVESLQQGLQKWVNKHWKDEIHAWHYHPLEYICIWSVELSCKFTCDVYRKKPKQKNYSESSQTFRLRLGKVNILKSAS